MNFRLTTRGLTIIAVTLTVVVVLLGVALAGTSRASFCSTCKNMTSDVNNLATSAHAGINCEQCHTKPGPFFFLMAKLQALQEPIHQLTGNYSKPIVGSALNESCERCHTASQLDKVLTVKGIRVDHTQIIEAGFQCVQCHSTVAHGNAVPVGSRTEPVMDTCLLCHDDHYTDAQGQVASSNCDLCHAQPLKNALPLDHRNAKWATDHGSVGVLSTCTICHKQKNYCATCHRGVEMPHAADWISTHGATATSLGTHACMLCHTKSFCDTCHKVKMPHPADFLAQHPEVAAEVGTQTCLNCHSVANCQACHSAHQSGTPQAHDLFSPTPSATTSTGSQGQ